MPNCPYKRLWERHLEQVFRKDASLVHKAIAEDTAQGEMTAMTNQPDPQVTNSDCLWSYARSSGVVDRR